MLSSADFILQQDLAPGHSAESWFNDHSVTEHWLAGKLASTSITAQQNHRLNASMPPRTETTRLKEAQLSIESIKMNMYHFNCYRQTEFFFVLLSKRLKTRTWFIVQWIFVMTFTFWNDYRLLLEHSTSSCTTSWGNLQRISNSERQKHKIMNIKKAHNYKTSFTQVGTENWIHTKYFQFR